MTRAETLSRIKSLLVEVLDLDAVAARIDDNELFFEGKLGMNSIAAIEILSAIEAEFDIVMEDEDISLDLFRTVNSLGDAVQRLVSRKMRDTGGGAD
jgi:acyl carrier protein